MQTSLRNLVSKQIRNIAGNAKGAEKVRTVVGQAPAAASSLGNVQHRIILPRKVEKKFDVAEHLPTKAVVKNNNVNIHAGLGSFVWDKHGERYLDMTSGIGVLGTGHCHPKVVGAMRDQMGDIVHAQQAMFFSHSKQDEFVEKFLEYTPGGGKIPGSDVAKHDTVLFTSSGSEATENAVKVAKMYTKRPNVIALNKGFHGRTFGAMAWSSSKTSYKSGFVNSMAGTFFVPEMTPESFDDVLAHQSAGSETAAVILEPVQGEGGVRQVPKEMMQHIRRRCDEHGMLLIFDEVQSGSGRCTDGNTFWAHELVGVEPDIMAFAKAIASGMPLGGICGPKKFFDVLSKNALGSTYGGNPVCLAAASATLDVIREENLLQNANQMGQLIAKEVAAMPSVTEVRQHGCLVAADLNAETAPVGQVIRDAVIDQNLILHSCGTNALRIIPAYNITENEVDLFADKLYAVLKGLGQESTAAQGKPAAAAVM